MVSCWLAVHCAACGCCCVCWVQVFSFKLRGAFNKMAKLPKEALQRGVITSSAGNHAQGVALAASKLVRGTASLEPARSWGAGSWQPLLV